MTAAMDTVTEADMAIAIAREGGIGIIHKNMSIERQADQVDMVKRSENGVIVDPFFLAPENTVREADNLMGRYKISGVPICENGKLVGIITNRDLRFMSGSDFDQKIENVMTKDHLVTAPVGTTLKDAQEILRHHRIEKLPIVDEKGYLKGLITIKDIEKAVQYPNSARDEGGRLLCGAAIGATADVLDRVAALVEAQVDVVVLDSAHGHNSGIIEAVKKVKKAYPDLQLIAGNVATAEGTRALIEAGADCVKIGIGPAPSAPPVWLPASACRRSRLCMTQHARRRNTAFRLSQTAASSTAVISSSARSRCKRCYARLPCCWLQGDPGRVRALSGRQFKVYRGMGSLGAMGKGSSDRYFQANNKKYVPEGVEGRVPYKGPLADTIYQMVGGLRSGMGYVGCANIPEMHEKAQFVRITGAGLKESHPHDIQITKEAPNYSIHG